jgi:hypothetical protein
LGEGLDLPFANGILKEVGDLSALGNFEHIFSEIKALVNQLFALNEHTIRSENLQA